MDDAGVFRIAPDQALVQTVDFFPPVVDDAFQYGRIAAANSLSDVYAMGGSPLTVLQVVGFPKSELPLSVLTEILKGGAEVIDEAGAIVVGGHSVVDQEIKYGLSVTGMVDPGAVVKNAGAKVGDRLYLTKPLGMGTVTTAHKKQEVDAEVVRQACDVMARLNKPAAEAMLEVGVHAATDVTGFGLMGHASEMARGSDITLRIQAGSVPWFGPVLELAERKLFSGGAARTRTHLGESVRFADDVEWTVQQLLCDAETSGGLLIAVAAERSDALEAALRARDVPVHCIGEAVEKLGVWIDVV